MQLSLVVFASLIVLALAGYAAHLLWRLRGQRQFQRQQQQLYLDKKRAHEDYLIDSIRHIAQGLLQDELDLSEAAIRLTYLLDALGLPEHERSAFSAVDALYEKVRSFDTHEARGKLTTRERSRQDSERVIHEASHREAVLVVARQLTSYKFDGFGSTQ